MSEDGGGETVASQLFTATSINDEEYYSSEHRRLPVQHVLSMNSTLVFTRLELNLLCGVYRADCGSPGVHVHTSALGHYGHVAGPTWLLQGPTWDITECRLAPA